MAASSRELMDSAARKLHGFRWQATVVLLIWYAWMALTSRAGALGIAVNLVVLGPLTAGMCRYFLSLTRGDAMRLSGILRGFRSFVNRFEAFLGIVLFSALWSVLLVVPGIIALLSYSMTFFVLAEDRHQYATDAITLSKEMMHGNRLKLCRFLLGYLLKCLPLVVVSATLAIYVLVRSGAKSLVADPVVTAVFGALEVIGLVWIGPHLALGLALFYEEIKVRVPAPVPPPAVLKEGPAVPAPAGQG